MSYRAVIERWNDRQIAYVCELPGCRVTASTVDTTLAALESAIPDYIRWLEGYRIPYKTQGSPELGVVEELTAEDGVGPFFSTDLQPPSFDEFEFALVVAAGARDDLIRLYAEASIPQRSYKHTPDEWSADEILMHIAERDLWYASRLETQFSEAVAPELPDAPLEAVIIAAIYVEQRMQYVFDIARSHKFEHGAEEWSLSKVIRRRTGHLRHHYPQLLLAVRQRMTNS